MLTPEQTLRRKECCVDWKTSEESDEFLERVITGDEFSPLIFFLVPQMQIGAAEAAFGGYDED